MNYNPLNFEIDTIFRAILLAIILIAIYFLPKIKQRYYRIIQKLNKKFQPPNPVLEKFFDGLKIKKVSKKTIITTLAIAVLAEITYYLVFPNAQINPIKQNILTVTILAPIIEEFIFRGLLLGSFLMIPPIIAQRTKKSEKEINELFIPTIVLMQAILFNFSHENLTLQTVIMGIIYGGLFIGNKKILDTENNTAPGIIAHATHNLATMMIYFLS